MQLKHSPAASVFVAETLSYYCFET